MLTQDSSYIGSYKASLTAYRLLSHQRGFLAVTSVSLQLLLVKANNFDFLLWLPIT